jgi:hypothetical protein
MFLAMKETRFAKRIARSLLKSHKAVSKENPDLSDNDLYREVLLHNQKIDPPRIDRILHQAENSVDLWTTSGVEKYGFRQVVHFVVMAEYLETGSTGSIVSFREIVYKLIPEYL